MFRPAALLALLAAAPAFAQDGIAPTVTDCTGWQANAANIAEPWEENTRTFANGNVRLTLIDTVEPVGGWAWLMIQSPPYDELGLRQCRMIGNWNSGFSRLDFNELFADYNPEDGLIFDIPAGIYVNGTEDDPVFPMRIILNQSTGQIETYVFD
ncbi:hypothetical protein [Sagittula sp. S175]|uniref:hypothetical protein n=1 Tax=Sagittula sp. S175 TaxID=3415129 RepID=UPI003C79DE2F